MRVSNETKVTEAGFLATVIEMAHLFGWRAAHFRAAMTAGGGYVTPVQADGKGFPDLFLLRPKTRGRFTTELKVGNNKPSPEQVTWLASMNACGIPAFLWTPCDWQEIEAVLRGGPGAVQCKHGVPRDKCCSVCLEEWL